MEMLFYGVLGWCGTKFPGWWRFPVPPHPDPEPWRNYLIFSVIGIAAGILGGTLFNNGIAENSIFAGQELLASGLVAFAASNIVTGFVGVSKGVKQ